jgi:hypothetical protein
VFYPPCNANPTTPVGASNNRRAELIKTDQN